MYLMNICNVSPVGNGLQQPWLHTLVYTLGDAGEVNPHFLIPDVEVSLVHSGYCVILPVISYTPVVAVEVLVTEA